MQYILTEQEYEDIKDKAEAFTKAQEYLISSIDTKPEMKYIYGKHGEKLARYDTQWSVCFNNLNFAKLFELLGIRIEGNVSMTFNND